MKYLLIAAFSATLFAQTLTLTPSSATVRPGQQVAISVNIAGTPTVAAIAYTLNAPAGWPIGTSTVGAAGTAATKMGACGATSPRVCIVFGPNNNLISAGVLASTTVTVPAATPPGSVQVSLSSISAGNAAAQPVAVTATPLTLTVLSLYDLNGDGSTNNTDMLAAVDQVVGTTSCSTADFNADGKCDAIDVLILIVKGILGL